MVCELLHELLCDDRDERLTAEEACVFDWFQMGATSYEEDIGSRDIWGLDSSQGSLQNV